ncbi:MAG: hypothetical protein M1117_04395 [Candidatus Thermoplasmatota archaeon]|uniref:Uncharacterized protein n=1 Tax=Candidatus Sysuiplasma superficiale TaxID=2823368 RepID=A0A8J7YQR7_9ARCH|nr:hypothetical protein [Candidatus Sysuiplasma superficiale]MCL4347137.1 hypothetical protein [Candidatus Thermoplasmatota archaeon]
MFDVEDDRDLGKFLKYQVFSFMFSTVLESKDGEIGFVTEGETDRLLQDIRIGQSAFDRFREIELPEKREREESFASERLSGEQRREVTASTLCHREEDACDWVLYEIYKRKVRTFSFEEGKKIFAVKLWRKGNCVISTTLDRTKRIKADVRIYALLKNVETENDVTRTFSPVVNLFTVIESVKGKEEADGSADLLPINFSYMLVDEEENGASEFQNFVISTFARRFLDEINNGNWPGHEREQPQPVTGRIFKTFSISLDSFDSFTPDPLFAFARKMKTGREQLLIVLYLLNLLFVDYDSFEHVNTVTHTPEFLEGRINSIMRINETSTVTYASPGSTITVDDYGDAEVKSHVEGINIHDERKSLDYNFGGPRNEVVFHTLILSTISSRASILNYYEKAVISSLQRREGNADDRASRAGRIRYIVEKATSEFSLHSFGPFQSPALEKEYDQISEINSSNELLDSFQKNVDFYGKYAIEEQHHQLMVEQSERLREEREILSGLQEVLRNMNESTERTEHLTAVLIVVSAISVIIALLFSLKIL